MEAFNEVHARFLEQCKLILSRFKDKPERPYKEVSNRDIELLLTTYTVASSNGLPVDTAINERVGKLLEKLTENQVLVIKSKYFNQRTVLCNKTVARMLSRDQRNVRRTLQRAYERMRGKPQSK